MLTNHYYEHMNVFGWIQIKMMGEHKAQGKNVFRMAPPKQKPLYEVEVSCKPIEDPI